MLNAVGDSRQRKSSISPEIAFGSMTGVFCEMQTRDYIYILELKIDQSADVALQQIEDKHYAAPFAADPRKLYKIGVSFSSETRRLSSWKIASSF